MTKKTAARARRLPEHADTAMLAAALVMVVVMLAVRESSPLGLLAMGLLVGGGLAVRVMGSGAGLRVELSRWQHLASHDGLTGLPNRLTFVERLDHTWSRTREVAVLYIDIDGFKGINDTLGHAAGDELLVQVAARLSAGIRDSDVVARFGGDEFVAFLSDCARDDAHEVAERLRCRLGEPYRVAGRDVTVSASIGICPPGACEEPADALHQADVALYRAKEAGRDRVSEYDPADSHDPLSRQSAAHELTLALSEGRLRLVYQPEVDLDTGLVTSVEALVRVDLGASGHVPLALMIAAAEEAGIAPELTEWVLDRALADASSWRSLGWGGRVSINVTCRELIDGTLPRQVGRLLDVHQVDGSILTVEFSETGLTEISETSARSLDLLRDMGVATTLDDFGTGPSSLALLREFPWDFLKVDHSLVAHEAGLAAPLARLCGELGHVVVAEGIETPDQLAEQRAAGVHHGQGYLLAAPLRREDVEPVLAVGQVLLPW